MYGLTQSLIRRLKYKTALNTERPAFLLIAIIEKRTVQLRNVFVRFSAESVKEANSNSIP